MRYYYDSQYSGGGEESFQRSNAAYERALALDPNLIVAAGQMITNRVERGELLEAYRQARSLVKRRPESAQAHFTMAYVDRYAGMLQDSTRECDMALKLDPGNFQYRSCAWAFLYMGNTLKAREFVSLDAGSEWANWAMPRPDRFWWCQYVPGFRTVERYGRTCPKSPPLASGEISPFHPRGVQ
jgi:tetratricopeptide (TPR) repeat protein